MKGTFRFYNELRKQAVANGGPGTPPSYETFVTMAKGLMEASKQVDLDKIKNPSIKDVFERTWAQKLLVYSTQKTLRGAYETLMKRY